MSKLVYSVRSISSIISVDVDLYKVTHLSAQLHNQSIGFPLFQPPMKHDQHSSLLLELLFIELVVFGGWTKLQGKYGMNFI